MKKLEPEENNQTLIQNAEAFLTRAVLQTAHAVLAGEVYTHSLSQPQ